MRRRDWSSGCFVRLASNLPRLASRAQPTAPRGVAAVGILAFLISWNELLFTLVRAAGTRTVPIGLYAFVGYQQIQWGELSAATVLMLAPVLAFVFQRQLTRGLSLGAVE